jgi:rhamnogalacturonyl hydrolase YesR
MIAYPEACTAYGSMRFAAATRDKQLMDKLVARYMPLTTDEGARWLPSPNHVDRSVAGIVPLEVFKHTGDQRFLTMGKHSADAQWAKPSTRPSEDGLTEQTRWWIDDMWMITGLQLQAYRATKDSVYLDRAAMQMAAYLDKLQQPNGLFFHGTDAQFCWGRGDGWVAVGLAELLSDLPENHPKRARIMEGYKLMLAALLKYQAPDGMWRQIIDDPQAWPETSCTGMFTFSMAVGSKKGWLSDPAYKAAAKKAFIALSTYLDEEGNVKEVCIGTNKGKEAQFYLDRPRKTGDLHGQAGFIWAAWAVLD